MMTRILASLTGVTLIVAVVAIMGGTVLPSKVEAAGGHKHGVTMKTNEYFIYAALDKGKHEVKNCSFVSGKVHFNIYVKDFDSRSSLSLHITTINKKGEIGFYESSSGICREIRAHKLGKTIKEALKFVGITSPLVAKRLTNAVYVALGRVVIKAAQAGKYALAAYIGRGIVIAVAFLGAAILTVLSICPFFLYVDICAPFGEDCYKHLHGGAGISV